MGLAGSGRFACGDAVGCRDLFGAVPVSQDDVDVWLERVAGLPAGSPRSSWYVKAYAVIDKIAAAKAAGEWPPDQGSIRL